MVGKKRGYLDLEFSKKDLHKHLDRTKRAKIKDGDAFASLSYLQAKANNDPLFFGKYTLTNDLKLENLFWAYGSSIIDHECFGYVVVFDIMFEKKV